MVNAIEVQSENYHGYIVMHGDGSGWTLPDGDVADREAAIEELRDTGITEGLYSELRSKFV